jgi:hypothetical protein
MVTAGLTARQLEQTWSPFRNENYVVLIQSWIDSLVESMNQVHCDLAPRACRSQAIHPYL